MFRIKFYQSEQQSEKQTKSTQHPKHLKWAFCLFFCLFVFSDFQSKGIAQKSTNPRVNQLTVRTPLNLIICLPLMYSVTKQQPVVVGQCSRKDWTAQLISTATGTTTNMALVTWKVSFGWDWTRFTGWPQIITACCVWTWRTLKGIQLMPSITCLVLWVRKTNTSWSLVLIQVELSFRPFYSSHSKRGEGGGRRVLSNVNMLNIVYINNFGRQKSNLSSSICNPEQRIPDVDKNCHFVASILVVLREGGKSAE